MLQELNEDAIDAKSVKEALQNPDGELDLEDKKAIEEKMEDQNYETYMQRIQEALKKLKENSESFHT